MTVKEEIVPTRTELSGSQRALLEERLKRAKQAASRPAEARASLPRRPAEEEIPLSFAQQRLWFLDQLEPGSPVYNVCQALRIQGALNVVALEQALNEVVRRHEVLRTSFVATEGRPVQVISPERQLAVTFVDLAATASGPARDALHRLLHEESRKPFDLSRDLLVRALLVKTGATEHTLMLTLHHIISDGWSIGILFRELAALYDGHLRGEKVVLPELPIQYADYVFWERDTLQGPTLDRLLSFWRKELEGPLPVLQLPVDHPRTVGVASRGAAQTIQLSRSLTASVKQLCQTEGATLFMTLLTAFQVLLHRWSGQEDIVVGSVVAGRRKVDLEKLIGFFVNTLVFRGDLGGDPTFRELLARTRDRAIGVLAHQDLPFERLVNELRPDRTLSRNPLFQAMFVLQNAPMAPTNLAQLQFEPFDVDNGTSKFDLTLSMMEMFEGLRAAIEYNADLFEAGTIAQMLSSFETLLESIVSNPDQRISRLTLLTPAARAKLLQEWNATTTPYPSTRTIPQLFEEQVANAPTSVALSFAAKSVTYGELDARANRLARWLRRAGVGPDTLVGVSMDRSVELVVALLGILKAGGAYVSLDPSYPLERLAYMLEDTAAPVLLTQMKLRERIASLVRGEPRDRSRNGTKADGATPAEGMNLDALPAKAAPRVICLDADWEQIAGESAEALPTEITPENLAYVSYTSGSTGQPKGVCVPHRGVVRLVRNTNYAHFGPDEVMLQFAPVAFDASTFEIWGALLNGARLAIFPPGASSLSELGSFLQREGVTTAWLTAGLFHQVVEEQLPQLKGVRQLLAGGDVLSPVHVARVLTELPGTRLINGYGPTENTTFTCCHPMTRAPLPGHSIPIGRPIANTQVYILDPNLEPVPVGVPGELYASGDGLARGYLNQAELTADKFIPHPFAGNAQPAHSRPETQADAYQPTPSRLYRTGDRARWLPDGTIEFLGRMDRQVKIRGFRVEPAEIEAVLGLHPAVKECAVVVSDAPDGEKRLVACVVANVQPAPSADVWREHLATRLPDYLVPSAFFNLAALPLTPNGKLDVRALPIDSGARPDLQGQYVAPRDDVERQLVAMWEEVLNVRPIGVHDQFFALGGHSLLAVRLVARLERSFNKKLPVAAIFQHRTIEQLAKLLHGPDRNYASGSSVVEIHGQGTRPRLYLVHGVGGGMFWGYANLARHLGNDQPLFAFKSRGLDGLPEWPTIEEMAASYIADLREHQPHGPYLLGGYCFGGIVAYEMARQLQAQGEEVALLALINGSPPNTGYQRATNRRSPLWLAKFAGNFAYWLGCFTFRWTWHERSEFVRWKLRVMRRKPAAGSQKHAEVALGDIDQLVDLAAYSDERRALWRAHVQALIKYHPGNYNGRVTLIRTRGHPLLCSFDWQYGWGELAEGGVDVNIVRGGHGNVLAEPYVGSVAEALRPRLDELAARQAQEVKS